MIAWIWNDNSYIYCIQHALLMHSLRLVRLFNPAESSLKSGWLEGIISCCFIADIESVTIDHHRTYIRQRLPFPGSICEGTGAFGTLCPHWAKRVFKNKSAGMVPPSLRDSGFCVVSVNKFETFDNVLVFSKMNFGFTDSTVTILYYYC